MPPMIRDQIVKEQKQLEDIVKSYNQEYVGTNPIQDAEKIYEETMRKKLSLAECESKKT